MVIIVVGIVAIHLFVVITFADTVIVLWVHVIVLYIIVVMSVFRSYVLCCNCWVSNFSLCSSTVKSYSGDHCISMCWCCSWSHRCHSPAVICWLLPQYSLVSGVVIFKSAASLSGNWNTKIRVKIQKYS